MELDPPEDTPPGGDPRSHKGTSKEKCCEWNKFEGSANTTRPRDRTSFLYRGDAWEQDVCEAVM
jgi:hypothetical protein